MALKNISQLEFPALLYDSLFALILFFSFDSFLDVDGPAHWVLYVFAMLVVIHWWLMFKAADDVFERGLRESAVGILINIGYLVLLDIILLYAQTFAYREAASVLLGLILLDMVWVIFMLRFERWGRFSSEARRTMQHELRLIIRTDLLAVLPLILLVVAGAHLAAGTFVALLVVIYAVYVTATFKEKIIDIRPL